MTKIYKFGDRDYVRDEVCLSVNKRIFPENKNIAMEYIPIDKSREHYHKVKTEYYLVTKGKGKVKLDGILYDVSEGDVVEISPDTKHKAIKEGGLEMWVVALLGQEVSQELKDNPFTQDNYFLE